MTEAVAAIRATEIVPDAWKTQRYERGMWVETNLHLDEPTATSDLVVIPLFEGAAPTLDENPYGWVIPKRGKRRAVVMLADDFDQSSAAAEADIDDLGYFPIYRAPPAFLKRIEALEAENAGLREALKPFADQAETFDSPDKGEFVSDRFEPAFVDHTIGDLRRARTALTQSGGTDG